MRRKQLPAAWLEPPRPPPPVCLRPDKVPIVPMPSFFLAACPYAGLTLEPQLNLNHYNVSMWGTPSVTADASYSASNSNAAENARVSSWLASFPPLAHGATLAALFSNAQTLECWRQTPPAGSGLRSIPVPGLHLGGGAS